MAELLAVVTITLLAVVSPGPDFAMVTRNSLVLSRQAGLLTAIGIGGGVFVHVAYTILGVGLLIQQSIWLFNALKLVGAAYLVWLGFGMLRAKPVKDEPNAPVAAFSDMMAIRVGFLTNALNPKTTIFIVSLFMQVVQPTTPLSIQIGYGAFISAAHIVWFVLVAFFFSAGRVKRRILRVRHWIDRVFGGMLVLFGVLLARTSLAR